MSPGVFRIVSDHRNLEEQIERQMGCMTGFLQLFDRHQILAGKQFYSTKRLLSSSTAESSSPSERSEMLTMPLVKEVPLFPSSPSPQGCPSSPENSVPTKSPRRHTLPLPVFELKDGLKTSWKLREAPRLSLDSRSSVDAKGKLRPRESQTTPVLFSGNLSEASDNGENHQEKQRRSPSVVARLMGLEVLPGACSGEPPKKPELRRSSSESRVPRDMSQFNFQESSPMTSEEVFMPYHDYSDTSSRVTKPESPRPPLVSLHRKSFFDSQEFFPEPKRVGSLYGEIEKRLRMRGIEEPAKDLETLKQILEALQLKGLLHSKPPESEDGTRLNVVYNRRPQTSTSSDQSPIVIMKPAPKPSPRLAGSQHRIPPPRSISPQPAPAPESIPPTRALRDRNLQSLVRQMPRSPEPTSTSRTPSLSPARRRPLHAEGQRAPLPQRRIPAVNSPKPSPRKQSSSPAGLPKNRRPAIDIPPKYKIYSPAEHNTPGLLSGSSSIGSPSQFDFERPPEYTSGRSLLERCDKLLHSIAAITSSAEPVNPTDRQPSPVSVLDSTFLSDDNLASPLPKRGINFNDQLTEWDEDHGNNHPSSTPVSNSSSGAQAPETTDDKGEDYAYVADVVRESDLNCGAFATIENRHQFAVSLPQHRRLLFDTVTELINRKRQLAPWDTFCRSIPAGDGESLVKEVWEELRRIQEHDGAEDAVEVTRAVIRKDMAAPVDGEQGWGVSGAEMSSAVLHIERQVFKDLVADTIRELADVAGRCRRTTTLSRRKLFF